MTPDAQTAIHAVRMKRIRAAVQALEEALTQALGATEHEPPR
jgi:hypothetical protein